MKMTVTVDQVRFARALEAEAARLARTARRAVNELAWRGVEDLKQGIRQAFDRPTDYVVNGATVQLAQGEQNTATVDWMSPRSARGGPGAGRVLRAEIEGGRRRDKRLDAALRFLGLPPGVIAVPGPGARLNANGDMDGATLRRILGELRQQGPGLRRRYFVVLDRDARKRIPRGIYEAKRRDRPVLIVAFVRDGTYRPRLDPAAIIRASVARNRAEVWRLALERRLPNRTSRGNIRP